MGAEAGLYQRGTSSVMKACAMLSIVVIVYGQDLSYDGFVPEGFNDATTASEDVPSGREFAQPSEADTLTEARPTDDNNSLMVTVVSAKSMRGSNALEKEVKQNTDAVAAIKKRIEDLNQKS